MPVTGRRAQKPTRKCQTAETYLFKPIILTVNGKSIFGTPFSVLKSRLPIWLGGLSVGGSGPVQL